jgi:ABC-2 type transport system permease protein
VTGRAIGRVARTEFRVALRDGRVRWAIAALLGLLLVTGADGWRERVEFQTEQAWAQRLVREQWLGQRPKDPHAAAHFGTYVFQPISELAFLDPGVLDHVGTAGFLEAHRRNEFRYRPAAEAPSAPWFGPLTPAAVLQQLVPLLVILLTYTALAAERESGMLGQLRSQGVPMGVIAVGKILGLTAILALVLGPSLALGLAWLGWHLTAPELAATLPRLGVLVLVYGTYYLTVLGVATAVSTRSRSAQGALVVLLGFWLVNGFLAPRLAAEAARRLAPVDSPAVFARELEAAAASHEEGSRGLGARGLQAAEDESNRRFDALYARWEHDLERQERRLQLTTLLAPGLAVRLVSMGLAGTDHAHHRHFATAAEHYRRTLVGTMNQEFVRSLLAFGARPGDAATWATVADFTYRPPGVAWVLRHSAWALGLLASWCLAAWVAAGWAWRRADA